MEWIVRFTAVWILFFLLIDWKELKVNIWCGLFSIVLQTAVDGIYIANHFYTVTEPIISVFGSSLFFILGPVFVIGVLISQYHPHKRWMQVLYVVLLSGVYDFEEYLLVIRKALVYTNWTYLSSVVFNLLLMMTLSWFSVIVLKRGQSKGEVNKA
ncbi:MAG: hypothetical protein N2645_22370 [Clostridia bacterium]|nr:hypothetical protein [Clostridia bacterium]